MNKRILAFFIDVFVAMILLFVLGLLSNINFPLIMGKIYAVILIISTFSLYLKDIFRGQSIGKRILKIKVVDFDYNSPNVLQLILRNITLFIWPVEALLFLLDRPRIGDRIAKTKVVNC